MFTFVYENTALREIEKVNRKKFEYGASLVRNCILFRPLG